MASLKLKSEEQIFGDMFARILVLLGLNDANPGSVLSVMLEAVAAEDFEQYVQMVSIIRNYNLDTTTGQELDQRGFEYGLTRNQAKKTTGLINILRAASFVKVSTGLYAGKPSPVKNGTKVFVNDGSNVLFGTSGTLVIGRGTANEEEVTYASAPTNNVNYWTFTVSPMSNDHGLDESVILKQGTDALVSAGTLIVVPATGTSAEIDFTVDQDTTLKAGDSEVDGVSITCSEAGSQGNIPINAINGTEAFASPPFAGARAYNVDKFTTGQDRENDEEFRGRIKRAIPTLSRGIKSAVQNAIIGLVDATSAKRVVSASVVLPVSTDENVKVFIDDGTGFEPSFDSQGIETVLAESTGGEVRLQLQHFPIVKAQLETGATQPYDMSVGALSLTYMVGSQSETITFVSSDFQFPNSASAQEIATAINSRSTLLQARTTEGSSKVIVFAVTDTDETLQVISGTANDVLGFPTDSRSTLYLYVGDRLLQKDGSTAAVISGNGTFNFSGLGSQPWPLFVTVDQKTANPQTVEFVSSDFAAPSAATTDEVIAAINARLAGATAEVAPGTNKIRLSTNTKLSVAGAIEITGGSANSILNFPTSIVLGSTKEYELNRFLGQIELTIPLLTGLSVTAGSMYTRGWLRCQSPETYGITAGQTLIMIPDGGASQTVTFTANGSFTAQQVADQINAQVVGIVAGIREVGGVAYLEASSATQSESGTLRISSSSTATGLSFPLNQTIGNQRSPRAFRISNNSGPYVFQLNTSLVVVLDQSPATKTFTIPMNYLDAVTAAVSGSVFSALALNSVFPNNDDLKNFFLVASSGANTTTGNVASVSFISGTTWRYTFTALPVGLAQFANNDQVTFGSLGNIENNGDFLVTGISTTGGGYIEVSNPSGIAEAGPAIGTMKVGARRGISAHVGATGALTLASPLPNTPGVGSTFAVLPYTTKNVVEFLNNTSITPLSIYAYIDGADGGTKVQIASRSNGSDGAVQVTGGLANRVLLFSTTDNAGLQAYQYYTGLLALVNKTIYGDDVDPVSFPGIGAGGIQFDVEAPTKRSVQFNINVTLSEGVSLSGASDQIKSAVQGYVNGLGVGDDVILSEVVAAVIAVQGVSDVVILSPTANIINTQNQLPRSSANDIVLG